MTSPHAQRAPSATIPTAREFLFSLSPRDDEASAAREKAFFRSIRLKNGTFKTTYARRLDSLNEIVNRVLPAQRPLEIMDVGASSGVATLEWMESLEKAGIEFRMTAGDLCVRAFLLSFGALLNVLVDGTGYPLQFDIGGNAMPFPPRRRLAITFPPLFIGLHAARWILPPLFAALFRRTIVNGNDSSWRRLGVLCRQTLLISPRLLERRSLAILDDDLLATGSLESRFDVIRAANLLNKSYFNDDNLRTMVENLRARLRRQGVLIVCRTHDDGVNHGTVFRLNDASAFEVVCRVGRGSEIEDFVR